jgi:hypothetical protein
MLCRLRGNLAGHVLVPNAEARKQYSVGVGVLFDLENCSERILQYSKCVNGALC